MPSQGTRPPSSEPLHLRIAEGGFPGPAQLPEADEVLAAQRGLLSMFPWVALGTALLVC